MIISYLRYCGTQYGTNRSSIFLCHIGIISVLNNTKNIYHNPNTLFIVLNAPHNYHFIFHNHEAGGSSPPLTIEYLVITKSKFVTSFYLLKIHIIKEPKKLIK